MNQIQRFGGNHRLSEAVTANGFVFLSGMVPEDTTDDVAVQTTNVLHQIDLWLARCHSNKSHILEATIYLTDMNDYYAMNSAWDAWVDPDNPPARACVQTVLAEPNWRVEIKVSALQIQAA